MAYYARRQLTGSFGRFREKQRISSKVPKETLQSWLKDDLIVWVDSSQKHLDEDTELPAQGKPEAIKPPDEKPFVEEEDDPAEQIDPSETSSRDTPSQPVNQTPKRQTKRVPPKAPK